MTRHDLKEQLQHDAFKDSITKAVEYTSTHKSEVTRWLIYSGAALVLIGALIWFANYRRSQREQDLDNAFAVLTAEVGQPNQFTKTFASEDLKRQASLQVLSGVVSKDGDSNEGLIARYYRGSLEASTDAASAERDLKQVADSRNVSAPLAKIALAQLYAGENRISDAQALLRDLMNKPAPLVSRDQAEILLAQLEQSANPQDAKRLLQSLKAEKNADPVALRAADQLSAQMAR